MRMFLTLIVFAGLVGLAGSCLFVVDQTEYVVQTRFGKPIRILMEPGLHFKWLWPVESLVYFDNRLMVLTNPDAADPDKEYLTQDEQSGIGKNVVVSTSTYWRIKRDQDAVRRFLETMSDRASAEERLGDIVVSELGTALGKHDFSRLVSTDPKQRKWFEFLDGVLARCRLRVDELAYGIEIVDIQIHRLNFPEQNRRNVFNRMRAERETIAAGYRSRGEEEAATIRAKADTERAQILAHAYEQGQRIRGNADAEAARIYAEAYGQDPEFYDFVRTLQAYEKTLAEGTVAILSSNSEFLRLLNRSVESDMTEPAASVVSQHRDPGRSRRDPVGDDGVDQ